MLGEMEFVRGWESRYAPDITGGLRLSKARLYRDVGEEEGLGDRREGEIRMNMPGAVTSETEGPTKHNKNTGWHGKSAALKWRSFQTE